jgi:hypothetical protein
MGPSIESHGVRFRFRVSHRDVLGLLSDRFPFGWKATTPTPGDRLYLVDIAPRRSNPGARRFSILHADGVELARTREPQELLDFLEADLRHHVAEHAPRRVFVHAGVVGFRGRAIVIPGRSHSGKSTLVGELIRAGATYYSDEYAVLDARGRVHPFAKPISIREGIVFKRTTRRSVASFGGEAGRKPLPVGLVVLCRYRRGRRFRPCALSAGQGTLEMVAHTVSARRDPAAALQALRQVAESASIITTFRGDAEETAARILEYAKYLESAA